MRSHILSTVGVAGLAIAIGCVLALPASASSHTLGVSSAKSVTRSAPHITAKNCHSQGDNDNGVGIVSQNFEASLDMYDS